MNTETVSVADTVFMSAALGLAQTALADGEFPVGCVIADETIEVARGHRTGTTAGSVNEIDHAEIKALRRLLDDMPDVDRSKLTIYCTMEPCLMCFSAILLSGIGRIVYAYEDVMGGGTGCDRSGLAPLYRNAQLTVISGVLRTSSLLLFKRFFADSANPYWADSLLSRYTLAQAVSP
ncbi:MAG: nucleoside deaminase [Desulfobacteraceae bacterium]|nr:nucleoside deaminase [Desulfobacteraceae bacterium]